MLLGDGFEQRFGFDNGANFFGEVAEDLFGVIGVAEEAAVDPHGEALGCAVEQERAPDAGGQDQNCGDWA